MGFIPIIITEFHNSTHEDALKTVKWLRVFFFLASNVPRCTSICLVLWYLLDKQKLLYDTSYNIVASSDTQHGVARYLRGFHYLSSKKFKKRYNFGCGG